MPTDTLIKEHYPRLFDFMESFMWPDADGGNVLMLLVATCWNGHPKWSAELISDLERIAKDSSITNEEVSSFFNRVSYRPYIVVNQQNAKDFCESMAEALKYIISKRT